MRKTVILGLGILLLMGILTACGGEKTSMPAYTPTTTPVTTAVTTTTPSVTTSATTKTTSVATTTNSNISVSAVPSTVNVKAGDKFDVSIRVKSDKPVRGLQFILSWDPSKINCDSVDQGSYFVSYAEKNEGTVFTLPSDVPSADNTTGIFPKPKGAQNTLMLTLTGAVNPDNTLRGVTGTGDAFILHMTAKQGASGSTALTLTNVKLVDNSEEVNDLKPAVVNGTVTINP